MNTIKCSLSNKLLLTLPMVEHKDRPVVQCTVGIHSEVKNKVKKAALTQEEEEIEKVKKSIFHT